MEVWHPLVQRDTDFKFASDHETVWKFTQTVKTNTSTHSSSVTIYVGLSMHKQLLMGCVECLLFYSVYQP